MKINQIKIKKIENKTSLKGIASIVIDDALVIHGIKIIEANNKIFLAFPNTKYNDKYFDICHPINSVARKLIEQSVLDEYKKLN